MKRSLKLFTMLTLSSALLLLASCSGNEHETSANITPPPAAGAVDPTAGTTAIPTEAPTQAVAETEQPTPEPTSPIIPRPENVTIEWLAGELMRRKYVSCIELELVDYSDIMDRNENTDLFFYDNQLEIDRIKLDLADNFVSATNHDTSIQRIVSESETEITVDMFVGTIIPCVGNSRGDSIGESVRITVNKQRMVIISYGEQNGCASRYKSWLEPLALRYRDQGMTWEDADKKAYEDILTEYVLEATECPRQIP